MAISEQLSASILDGLNEAQRDAVQAPLAHRLVLAGAGSGKTRTLVHRMVWVMCHYQIASHQILAVTFTNKAAAEMRTRIEALLQRSVAGMWIGTFHGLAHRFLRAHVEAAGLPDGFQILDADDQLRLIRRIHKELALDEARFPPKKSQWFINTNKDAGRRAGDVALGFNPVLKRRLEVYTLYEQQCLRSGLVDFAELLLRMCDVLQQDAALLAQYQSRFRYILVDEFQDTNTIQYIWLKLLAGDGACVMAVGDDDQSIYGWRGAKPDNLLHFQKDFSGTEVVRLERNYRSTGNILAGANGVIGHNENRMGKELWTSDSAGERISVFCARDGFDEARFVVSQVQAHIAQGSNYSDMAILYRSNAQSRVLEEVLRGANMPYRVYGGQRFFERAEIKDALAYLRLVVNRHDDSAFERVVNTPPRGIGQATVRALRDCAYERRVSLWDAAVGALNAQQLATRAANCLQVFLTLIDTVDDNVRMLTLSQQASGIMTDSGLLEHLMRDKTEQGRSRLENIDEFINAMRQFADASAGTAREQLCAFLAYVTLDAGEVPTSEVSVEGDAAPVDHHNYVQMMTLHAAKGLEFPVVFLTGLEEGLFPHKMSTQESGRFEEERRLCYVGMTRAKRKLYLTYAETRRLHGQVAYHLPSPFLREVPEALLEYIANDRSPRGSVSTASSYASSRAAQRQPAQAGGRRVAVTTQRGDHIDGTALRIGQQVRHPRFGVGTVLDYEGGGQHARLQIRFQQVGMKWLVLSYANLEIV